MSAVALAAALAALALMARTVDVFAPRMTTHAIVGLHEFMEVVGVHLTSPYVNYSRRKYMSVASLTCVVCTPTGRRGGRGGIRPN